jgi:hypothetical protein
MAHLYRKRSGEYRAQTSFALPERDYTAFASMCQALDKTPSEMLRALVKLALRARYPNRLDLFPLAYGEKNTIEALVNPR